MGRSSSAIAIPVPSPRAYAPATAGALLAGLFAGAVGASVFALYFLALDVLRGEALETPALVGAVVLHGASPLVRAPVDLVVVGAYSLVHALLFVSFAALASLGVARLGSLPKLPLLALGLALGLEASFLVATALLAPGLGGAIGHGVVLVGNGIAGLGMAIVMRRDLAV